MGPRAPSPDAEKAACVRLPGFERGGATTEVPPMSPGFVPMIDVPAVPPSDELHTRIAAQASSSSTRPSNSTAIGPRKPGTGSSIVAWAPGPRGIVRAGASLAPAKTLAVVAVVDEKFAIRRLLLYRVPLSPVASTATARFFLTRTAG